MHKQTRYKISHRSHYESSLLNMYTHTHKFSVRTLYIIPACTQDRPPSKINTILKYKTHSTLTFGDAYTFWVVCVCVRVASFQKVLFLEKCIISFVGASSYKYIYKSSHMSHKICKYASHMHKCTRFLHKKLNNALFLWNFVCMCV